MTRIHVCSSIAGLRLIGIAAFIFAVSLVPPSAYAQSDDTRRAQFPELKTKAENGDAEAQYFLGIRYASGNGVQKDDKEALKWYRKAADQNLVRAQITLGVRYASGNGVQKDDKEALKWYRKAADQNSPVAQYAIGNFYAKGEGVSKDEKEAANWYRKAAELNLSRAQSMVGWCYYQGVGVEKDYSEAYAWYTLAMDNFLKPGSGNDKDMEMHSMKQREDLMGKMSPQQLVDGKKRLTALQAVIGAKKNSNAK